MFIRWHITFFVGVLIIPLGVISAQEINVTTTGGGSINNKTTSVSNGENAHTSVQVKNILGSDGTLDVEIETNVNGVVEQKHVQEKIEGSGSAEIYIGRTNESPSTNTIIEINSDTSSTKALSMFERWATFFSRGEEEMNVDIEVNSGTTSSPRGTNIFASVYRNVIRLLASIWQ